MKKISKYIIVALAAVCLMTFFSTYLVMHQLEQIRQESNRAIWNVIAVAKKENPALEDIQIARMLNGKAEYDEVREVLKKYGIHADDWGAVQNEENSRKLLTLVIGCFLFQGVVLGLIFLRYRGNQKREMDEITAYMMRLNNGIYRLDLEENSEDAESLLKNEIYKTTVMLREQRERSIQDKVQLKNSLSDISHQLKTPLTSIILMVENILEDEEMPAEIRREFIRDIRKMTGNISFLVQSLLTLSKLEVNTVDFGKKKENMRSLLNEVEQNIAVLADVKGVELTYDCEENVNVMCDRRWAVEAISNIVKNCVEHTNAGGCVKMTASENKLYTKLVIADTGVGIAKEDLPHIFERFYKGKNSDPNSVGIGLALSKALIEKNDGFIRVESECGKGTTYTIQYFHSAMFKK